MQRLYYKKQASWHSFNTIWPKVAGMERFYMSYTIAVAGKGGVGKTSFCALLIRWLIQNKKTPILAVDADPNSNLSEALGVRTVFLTSN